MKKEDLLKLMQNQVYSGQNRFRVVNGMCVTEQSFKESYIGCRD